MCNPSDIQSFTLFLLLYWCRVHSNFGQFCVVNGRLDIDQSDVPKMAWLSVTYIIFLHHHHHHNHHHQAAVVSRGWANASACRFQITLSCAVLCHIVSLQYLPGRLSIARLVSLVVFSCHMVSKWWHARSIGRL